MALIGLTPNNIADINDGRAGVVLRDAIGEIIRDIPGLDVEARAR